jgi:hypothetical protein
MAHPLRVAGAVLALGAIAPVSALAAFDTSAPAPRRGPALVVTTTATGTVHADAPTLPGGPPPTIAWDLDADGQFDDAGGTTAALRPGDDVRTVRARAQWLTFVPIARIAHTTVADAENRGSD